MDCLTHLPHVVDPEVHYEVQSKRGLAVSGIPTPSSEVIDTILRPDQVNVSSLVEPEVARMTKPIVTRSPPFVIKMAQSCSGQGVWVVRSEADKKNALDTIARALPKLIQQTVESNQHLNPSSFILQEMVPSETRGLSLFITKAGRPIFLGCCRQYVDDTGHWAGGFMSYDEQKALELEYASIAKDIARHCHKVGYYGPFGVDVMDDGKNQKLVIDPNARVQGTTPLCFLKDHFTSRNMKESVIFFPLFLTCTLDEFEKIFASELSDGSLIIIGWSHYSQISVTSVILGAENQEKLGAFIYRLKVYKVEEEG
ncbi:hypothetical protein HYALB_00004895 [Hymenoscyphus albidus]|uniref:ATP-grasp domain-containing protein n=1 Tax=Hymenoscyphus albidus TaxID=595503 RepID=A0A9N9Q3E1_9HELO|nr:hypothetical protein HYALB_00004895 [Hymenoscyphus albidus]